MTELQQVRQAVYDRLFLDFGYPEKIAKEFTESIVKITGYFDNKPSRVLLSSGLEIFI